MKRLAMIDLLLREEEWDVCIIGGGATGLGIAVDAASRGLKTLLFEKYDFAKGTSSRSTKLVHGGVRYLQQGNIKLVWDALHERGLMMRNAPHLVKNLSFIIPNYEWWEHSFYGLGLKAYDWMAGKLGLGASVFLSVEETMQALPSLRAEGLRGGVLFHDGQFDDARMAIHLAMTAADHHACVLNYFSVNKLLKFQDHVTGVEVQDTISHEVYQVKAKVVINAAGVFSSDIQQMDDATHETNLVPSQGIHLVFDKSILPADTAVMIPRTVDGRVLFAVPWHHKIIVGTTDSPAPGIDIEPIPMQEEILFILDHISHYLTTNPQLDDIRSVFTGLRPLVKGGQKSTSALSREHFISVSSSGLISIQGGKWTTYRKMAEDVLQKAIERNALPATKSITAALPVHGYVEGIDFHDPLYYYGSDKEQIMTLVDADPTLGVLMHKDFPNIMAEVKWAVLEEMCMTVEDMLARRTRLLFLDAKASCEAAPQVAITMAKELGKDQNWIDEQLAAYYLVAKNYLPAQM